MFIKDNSRFLSKHFHDVIGKNMVLLFVYPAREGNDDGIADVGA